MSLVTTRVEFSQRVVYDQAIASKSLGSPVNPHDVVNGGY